MEPTPLPDDFPGRKALIEAGHQTVEAVRQIDDLSSIKGVGDSTAIAIEARLDAGSGTEDFPGDAPAPATPNPTPSPAPAPVAAEAAPQRDVPNETALCISIISHLQATGTGEAKLAAARAWVRTNVTANYSGDLQPRPVNAKAGEGAARRMIAVMGAGDPPVWPSVTVAKATAYLDTKLA